MRILPCILLSKRPEVIEDAIVIEIIFIAENYRTLQFLCRTLIVCLAFTDLLSSKGGRRFRISRLMVLNFALAELISIKFLRTLHSPARTSLMWGMLGRT